MPEFFWPEYIFIDNTKIKLRGEPYSFGIKHILKKGDYELPERKLLRPCNLEGETIIEMGGSIGILTAILANKVGNSGKVISIEASEKISAYSRSWLESNHNTKILTGFAFPVAEVANKIHSIKFKESGSSLEGRIQFIYENKTTSDSNSIYDIKKISDLYNLKPTVLVVDIEGTEKIILDQKPNFPSSIKLILIELHPQVYGESNKSEIIKRIIDEGFLIKNSEGIVFLFERSL
ncbi:MAG: FkbM family methyltransferase [Ignavibacteriaceae bacterium]|nr:FkbM family methyltransferase [Ignavibacteriaceae bacterium]